MRVCGHIHIQTFLLSFVSITLTRIGVPILNGFFSDERKSPINSIFKEKRDNSLVELYNLLDTYSREHSLDELRKEPHETFCHRKYITHTYSYSLDCESIGNKLGSFLSNAVYAVITNRTLYLHDNLGNNCNGLISTATWLPFQSDIEMISQTAGCPVTFNSSTVTKLVGDRKSNSPPKSFPSYEYYLQSKAIVFDYWLFNKVYEAFHPSQMNHSNYIMQRARAFFGSSTGIVSRYSAYGIVSRYFVSYGPQVIEAVQPILQQTLLTPNSARISVHIRHFDCRSVANTRMLQAPDARVIAAIQRIRKTILGKCFIYLATDRKQSTATIIAAEELRCEIFQVPRQRIAPSAAAEHGPWGSGLMQIADLYLLSHGDYIVGTNYSTYSVLITNAVALRSLETTHRTCPLLFVDTDTRKKLKPTRWLEDCGQTNWETSPNRITHNITLPALKLL